jgi:hypothetical protein
MLSWMHRGQELELFPVLATSVIGKRSIHCLRAQKGAASPRKQLLAGPTLAPGHGASASMETELAAACTLLQAEFPDTPRSLLESALREVELDIPAARRKLLELQTERGGAGESFRGPSVSGGLNLPLCGAASPSGTCRPCMPTGIWRLAL